MFLESARSICMTHDCNLMVGQITCQALLLQCRQQSMCRVTAYSLCRLYSIYIFTVCCCAGNTACPGDSGGGSCTGQTRQGWAGRQSHLRPDRLHLCFLPQCHNRRSHSGLLHHLCKQPPSFEVLGWAGLGCAALRCAVLGCAALCCAGL